MSGIRTPAHAESGEGPAEGRECVEPAPQRQRVALATALTRRERWETALQKVTELGVSEVLPFVASRCVVRLDARRSKTRVERWRRIAMEVAATSQRSEPPRVHEPVKLRELAADVRRFDVVLVAWEEAGPEAPGIGEALRAAGAGPTANVLLIVGPEDGLTSQEVGVLQGAGAVVVTLGDRVLRTETAAIAAVTLAIYEMGGLGGRAR